MSQVSPSHQRTQPDPLPENITSVQPGSGFGYRVELAWGRWRRRWLKRFRRKYVARMQSLRQGSSEGAPHEILDPRDLKYCRNLCTAHWLPKDDPFAWREKIPLARWGLAELQIFAYPLLAATILLAWLYWPLALVPGVLLLFVISFFRDPPRQVPVDADLLISPADGTIAEVTELEHDEFVGGPAVRIGIFLSIFNVHINRFPETATVVRLGYFPGKFLNALKPESARENENMWIGLECEPPPHRRLVVRQISGAIARRIVCDLKPGDVFARGHKFGMIKFGSRTELILPLEDGLQITCSVGDKIKAGSHVLAKYPSQKA